MFDGYQWYTLLVLLGFLMAILGLFRNRWVLVAFIGFSMVSLYALIDMMARPRPVSLILPSQMPAPETANLMGLYMVEDEFIMMLLMWDGLEYPLYFRFPWDADKAKRLQGAVADAAEQNTNGVNISRPFDPSLENRDQDYAYPAPPPSVATPKPDPTQKVFRYTRPTN